METWDVCMLVCIGAARKGVWLSRTLAMLKGKKYITGGECFNESVFNHISHNIDSLYHRSQSNSMISQWSATDNKFMHTLSVRTQAGAAERTVKGEIGCSFFKMIKLFVKLCLFGAHSTFQVMNGIFL